MKKMKVRHYRDQDKQEILPFVAGFRIELAALKGVNKARDVQNAEEELNEYLNEKSPVFVAEAGDGHLAGYLVCRIVRDVVWAESLYVRPEDRRTGIGSRLYREVERIAKEHGCDTVYNWVHPNNERIIQFLRKLGYNVLNLVEIRKQHPGETLKQKITVDKFQFDY